MPHFFGMSPGSFYPLVFLCATVKCNSFPAAIRDWEWELGRPPPIRMQICIFSSSKSRMLPHGKKHCIQGSHETSKAHLLKSRYSSPFCPLEQLGTGRGTLGTE